MTLVDANVLIDVFTNDRTWQPWSADAMDRQAVLGPMFVTGAVYAELSSQFAGIEILDATLADLGVVLRRIPAEGLFHAGHAFARYRKAGGLRQNVLADFFIGAHAQVEGFAILTRDTRRYRAYFPDVGLIAPD